MTRHLSCRIGLIGCWAPSGSTGWSGRNRWSGRLDEVALVGALEGTDDEDDRWFEYSLQGLPPLMVCLARQEGCSEVIVVVRGGFDDVLAARIETLLDLS